MKEADKDQQQLPLKYSSNSSSFAKRRPTLNSKKEPSPVKVRVVVTQKVPKPSVFQKKELLSKICDAIINTDQETIEGSSMTTPVKPSPNKV